MAYLVTVLSGYGESTVIENYMGEYKSSGEKMCWKTGKEGAWRQTDMMMVVQAPSSKDPRIRDQTKTRNRKKASIALEIYGYTTSSAHETGQERSPHITCLQDRPRNHVQGAGFRCAVDAQLAPRQCPSIDNTGPRSAHWLYECLLHSGGASASQRLW